MLKHANVWFKIKQFNVSNLHPLEVVSLVSETQLQVGENLYNAELQGLTSDW